MKITKTVSLILGAVMTLTALASCAETPARTNVEATSSGTEKYAEYLDKRLGGIPDRLVLGIGSDSGYGVNMDAFESDGYIIRTDGDAVLLFGKTGDALDAACRKYAKAIEAGRAVEDTVYHEGARIKELRLFGTDISEYKIVLAEDANENMKFAADELIRLVEKACGAKLVYAPAGYSGKTIEFRFSDREDFRFDGYRYFEEDGNLVFEGAVKRGSLYGVWRFLENECGWDALIFGESHLRDADLIDVAAGLDKTEIPAFDFFECYQGGTPAFARIVNERATPTPVQNSYGVMEKCCHGMSQNEWCGFYVGYEQMCYTDEDNYQTCVGNITDYIEAQLDAGRVIGRDFFAIDLAQGDNNIYCQCLNCRRVLKEEGANSGAVLRFANRLSEEMGESYPGLYYQIFAYSGSNEPPKVTKASKYVSVTFCTDLNCSNHPLDGSECKGVINFNKRNNKDYAAWLEGWCDICDSVYVWCYALDAVFLQFTVLDNLYSDFRYLASLGVDGIFWQCLNYGQGLSKIQYELAEQIQWNPSLTEEEFEVYYEKYMENEYGDAWHLIDEYVGYWIEAFDRTGCWTCWDGGHAQAEIRFDEYYYNNYFDHFVELFDRALLLADNSEIELSVTALSMHMLYMGCYSGLPLAYKAHDTERMAVLNERYNRFIECIRKTGMDPYCIYTTDGYHLRFELDMTEEAALNWVKKWGDGFTVTDNKEIIYEG